MPIVFGVVELMGMLWPDTVPEFVWAVVIISLHYILDILIGDQKNGAVFYVMESQITQYLQFVVMFQIITVTYNKLTQLIAENCYINEGTTIGC